MVVSHLMYVPETKLWSFVRADVPLAAELPLQSQCSMMFYDAMSYEILSKNTERQCPLDHYI